MAADVDAPDKVLYGLTFRQLAILAVAAVVFYGAWQALHTVVPVPVLLGAGVVVGGLVFGLAVGPPRRPVHGRVAARRGPALPRAAGAVDHRHRHRRVPDWVQPPPADGDAAGTAEAARRRDRRRRADQPRRHAGRRWSPRPPSTCTAHRRRAGRPDRRLRPLAQQPRPPPPRSSCRRSRSTCARTPAPSPPPPRQLPHPALAGGVRRPRRVPRRPRRTPRSAAPAGPRRHPHHARRSAASTPPAAAPTTPSAPCPASASPPAPSTGRPPPRRSPPPPTPTGRRAPAAWPPPTPSSPAAAARPAPTREGDRHDRRTPRRRAPQARPRRRRPPVLAATVAPALGRGHARGACASATATPPPWWSPATRPRSARPGWNRCCPGPGRLDLALHIDPLPAPIAAARLRNQRARFESSRRADADKGKLADPYVDAAADDAADLAQRLARGAAKLFRVGLYLTVHARTEPELLDACAQVKAAAASTLLEVQPATWRHLAGWTTTLPLATDCAADAAHHGHPGPRRRVPARLAGPARAAARRPAGHRRRPLRHQPRLATASSGGTAGRRRTTTPSSWPAPAPASRTSSSWRSCATCYQGVQVSVIDPEDEYLRLADAVGGTIVRLGARRREDQPPRPARRRHPPGRADPPRAVPAHPDRACCSASSRRRPNAPPWTGPSSPSTGRPASPPTRPPTTGPPRCCATSPRACAPTRDPAAAQLAARLAPWVDGSFSDLFDGPTTTRPDGHLVVWSLRHLPDELRTVGTLLALDSIWRQRRRPRPPNGRARPPPGRGRRGVAADARRRRRQVPVPHVARPPANATPA